MNKLYKRTLLYVIFLLSTSPVFATHIMGMDLSYTCVGNNTYTFTLNFYRDCTGIAPIIKPFRIHSDSCNFDTTLSLNQVGNPKEISPLCLSYISQSTCNGGTYPGVQVWVYQVTYQLPFYCKDWKFYYDDIARNPLITNIVNPGNTGIRIADSLDNSSKACVNSPVFSNPPVPYVCDGYPF